MLFGFMCVDVTISYLPSAQTGCFGNLVPGAQVLVEIAGGAHTRPMSGLEKYMYMWLFEVYVRVDVISAGGNVFIVCDLCM